jgi:hypothetical protein
MGGERQGEEVAPALDDRGHLPREPLRSVERLLHEPAYTGRACFETRAEGRAPQHEVIFIFLKNPNLHPKEAAQAAISKDLLRLPASLAQKSPLEEGKSGL